MRLIKKTQRGLAADLEMKVIKVVVMLKGYRRIFFSMVWDKRHFASKRRKI